MSSKLNILKELLIKEYGLRKDGYIPSDSGINKWIESAKKHLKLNPNDKSKALLDATREIFGGDLFQEEIYNSEKSKEVKHSNVQSTMVLLQELESIIKEQESAI